MAFTKAERLTERETIFRWDGHKDVVNLFTASPAIKRKVERAGHGVKQTSTVKGQEIGWGYAIPYRHLSWSVRARKTGQVRGGFGAKRSIP